MSRALVDELRRVAESDRACLILHVLEVAGGAHALASIGVRADIDDDRGRLVLDESGLEMRRPQ